MAKGIGPLLLIGGAAAVWALTKKKDGACPPRIVVDEAAAQNKMIEKAAAFAKKMADNVEIDPAQAADEFFSLFAPIECKHSKSLIVLNGKEVVASELYTKLLASFTAGAAMGDVFESFKEGACPATAMMSPDALAQAKALFDQVDGGKSPGQIADEAFGLFAPIRCKWNEGTIIDLGRDMNIQAPAPDVWGAVLGDVVEAYVDKGIMTNDDAEFVFAQFQNIFKAKMGRDWKDPLAG